MGFSTGNTIAKVHSQNRSSKLLQTH